MRLPNGARAEIDGRKLTDYLLSMTHPIGRFKAKFFQSVGFEASNTDALRAALLAIAVTGEVSEVSQTEFGQKYVVFGVLAGPGGRQAEVATIWFLPGGADTPRLVTVYPR